MLSSIKIIFVPKWTIFIAMIGLFIARIRHNNDFKKLTIITIPLVALLVFYSFYYIKDFRFIVPGVVFLFILIGYGLDSIMSTFRSNYIKIVIGILFFFYITNTLPGFITQYKTFAVNTNITEQNILLSQKHNNKILFTNDYVVYWEEILGKNYTVYPLLKNQLPLTIGKGYGFTKKFINILKANPQNTNTYYVMNTYLTDKQWNFLVNDRCIANGTKLYAGSIIRFRCE